MHFFVHYLFTINTIRSLMLTNERITECMQILLVLLRETKLRRGLAVFLEIPR